MTPVETPLKMPQVETPPKARRGARPGMHRQLRWQADPVVLARLEAVADLRGRGLRTAEIARALGVSRDVVQDDGRRLAELAEGHAIGSLQESVERLRTVYRLAMAAFGDTPSGSLNRSAYLSVARQAVMDEARLLGQVPTPAPQVLPEPVTRLVIQWLDPEDWRRHLIGPAGEIVDAAVGGEPG